ncbi:MAG: Smr/MutS family protein [Myxococcales bacterium]|nr:Smr/MutS family protein [Myxococcales bacterium]
MKKKSHNDAHGKKSEEEAALEKAAKKAAHNPDPLGHKGLAGLSKLKAELDERERKTREAAEAKAKKEAEFRAKIGLAPEKKRPEAPSATAPTKSSGDKSGARRSDSVEVWRPDLEKELFAVAMSGVEKLPPKSAGNRVHHDPAAHKGKPGPLGAKVRRAAAEGDVGLTVKWSENGTCQASRAGAAFALEALDRLATPQDSIDLHGLEAVEARARVLEFVRSRRARGLRVVEVVHGTGKHAPDGHCVLRDAAAAALSEVPGSREVEAFKSKDAGPSGSAAILVALRPR